MHIRSKRLSKNFLLAGISVLLISVAQRGAMRTDVAHAQEENVPTRPIPLVVPDFHGASDAKIVALRNGVEEQQDFIRRTLLEQLQDEHLSPLARMETISLLGSFRGDEVVDALIQNMNFVAVPRPDDSPIGAGRVGGFLARHVLARIGLPAEEEILRIIGSRQATDAQAKANPALRAYGFEPSKVEGFADVLTRIEGNYYSVLKLQNAQRKAATPAIKAQFQAVIKQIRYGKPRRPFYY